MSVKIPIASFFPGGPANIYLPNTQTVSSLCELLSFQLLEPYAFTLV